MDADRILNLGVWSTLERWLRPSRVKSDTVIPASARLEKLNDHVFEVRKPAGCSRPSLEIVFFHGLQLERSSQPHVTTWLSEDKSELWLTWLQDDNPDIRVLIVSYDASIKRTEKEGRTDMFITCENLVHNLTGNNAHVGQDGCPVILVGHCLGGLVMKEVCVKANSILSLQDPIHHDHQVAKVQKFLENVKGVFFYATPHHGAIILPTLNANGSSDIPEGSLLKDLGPLNEQAQRRNEDFRMLRQKWKWKAAGVGEGRKVSTDNFTGFVVSVPEASARSEIDAMGYYTIMTADHFNICRPADKICASFSQLWNFIVQVLMEYQQSVAPPLSIPEDLVGMHKVIEEVEESLKSTKRLAIIGMGGIGKTTLAKCLYEHIKGRFQYACLLDDVKTKMGDQKDISHLQKLVLEGLTVEGKHKVDAGFDWERLKNKKILIVLDGVEKKSHVKMMGGKDGLSEESRVIVTSRNKTFLGTEGFRFHDMELLADHDSYKLLCLCAFGKEEAPDEFEGHVKEVLKKCGNLPLAIEVVGSSLFGRELIHWTEMTETIAGAHSVDGSYPDELWAILRRSFDSLDGREQEMFLDIATCFHGVEISEVKKAWRFMSGRSAESGWQNLVDRCLAEEDDPKGRDAYISMHELLRDLGKSIACPSQAGISPVHTRIADVRIANNLSSAERSRVQILKLHNGSLALALRSQWYPRDWPFDEHLDMRVLHEFHDLKALWLNERATCDYLPKLLKDGYIFPPRLTYVHLLGAGSMAMNEICRIQGLRCLILHVGVKELPPSLGQLVHLEYLEMVGCSIREIPREIAQLRSLRRFCIIDCNSLSSLPSSIIQLEALQAFEVSACYILRVPLLLLCKLRALRNMSEFVVDCRVDGCYDLRVTANGGRWVCVVTTGNACQINEMEWRSTKIPGDVGTVVHLWDLGEEACFYVGGFENVPRALNDRRPLRMEHLTIRNVDDIDLLSTLSTDDFHELRTLEIINCGLVDKLPVFGPQLWALRHLRIDDLSSVKCLPELWQLQGLQSLELSHLPRLERLPESVGHLRVLKSLRLAWLRMLSGLPESIGYLQALTVMDLIGLPELDRLPKSLGQLTALRDLRIHKCACLRYPWGSTCNWSLRSLETLALNCGYFRDSSQTPDSRSVCYEEKSYLQELRPSWFFRRQPKSRMVAIEVLEAAAVREKFPRLECVALTLRMQDVELFADFGRRLSPLRHLTIVDSPGFMKLPDSLGQFGSLKFLDIAGCSALVELPASVGQLYALEQLKITGCHALLTLPESWGKLGSLKFLKVNWCDALVELPEWVGQLPALEHLEIVACKKLTKLKGGVGQIRTLDCLIISGSTSDNTSPRERLAGILHSLAVVERVFLKRLTIQNFSLHDHEDLSASFGQLLLLEHLDIVHCWNIKSLPQSAGQIRGLKCLTVEDCQRLEELPESTGQLGLLRRVAIKRCPNLSNLDTCLGWLGALEDLEIDRRILAKLAGHLRQLGSLKRLTVETLWLSRAELRDSIGQLELPDSLGQLGALEELAIRNENGRWHNFQFDYTWELYKEMVIKKLPESIGQLSTLKRLEISYCEEIMQLPATVGELSQLEKIVVRHCPNLEAWRPSARHLQHVQELELTYEDRESYAPKLKYNPFEYDFKGKRDHDELRIRNEVFTIVLQGQDLRETAEEGRSLLEAAMRLRDQRVLEEAGLA